ncbi:MAG: MATE family efflux transporter [Bacteroidota bacterium]
MSKHSQELGSAKISSLLVKQSVPASIGILIMSIYGIVDTIFVGQYVGSLAIAAITVVLPITFLISSIGMAIGIGGGSIISRALGSDDREKANLTFGNQLGLTSSLAIFIVILGFIFEKEILVFFGANGDILEPASQYFQIILIGVPFLAWAMMSNNIIRAEGEPRAAMLTLMVPALVNLILDPIFIIVFDWGLEGAAWATSLSYMMSAAYTTWFFFFGKSELRITSAALRPQKKIVAEIFSIGGVTLARQGVVSLFSIVLNHTLFQYGQEMAVAVFGIVNRMMMFANFPVLGLLQGTLPIIGFNFGAKKWKRVKETIKLSIMSGTGISFCIFILIMLFPDKIASVFTEDEQVVAEAANALRKVFLATPLLLTQLIGSGYYQAIGKPLPALFLALSKQGFCLIPLLYILPNFFGLDGVWYAFPVADFLTAIASMIALRIGFTKLNQRAEAVPQADDLNLAAEEVSV